MNKPKKSKQKNHPWLKATPVLKGKAAEEFLRKMKETDDWCERIRNKTATPEDLKVLKATQDRLWNALKFFSKPLTSNPTTPDVQA